jgi:hypothetical protein
MAPWSSVDDLVAVLQKRWRSGRYLSDYAKGLKWTPIELPIKAPSAKDLLDQFDDVVKWIERFQRECRTSGGRGCFVVEYRTIKGRNLGSNSVPVRVRVESFDQLCTLLRTNDEVRSLDRILEQTNQAMPEITPWVVAHPLKAISYAETWSGLLAILDWIAATPTEGLYLRQMDVEGIDTKFVDCHRRLLDELLVTVLPEGRIDTRYSAGDFTRRYRFRPKPEYTRFRVLESEPALPGGLSELTVRTEELATLELTCGTVFIVENEITFLAFPRVPDAIVVFGSGFGVTSLRPFPGLEDKEIVYWGDIDTHGFDILSRLRARFDRVRSMLMDRPTLFAHRGQWVTEPNPTSRALSNLTEAERELYGDLIEGRFGPAIRLEQERVRFSILQLALQA